MTYKWTRATIKNVEANLVIRRKEYGTWLMNELFLSTHTFSWKVFLANKILWWSKLICIYLLTFRIEKTPGASIIKSRSNLQLPSSLLSDSTDSSLEFAHVDDEPAHSLDSSVNDNRSGSSILTRGVLRRSYTEVSKTVYFKYKIKI